MVMLNTVARTRNRQLSNVLSTHEIALKVHNITNGYIGINISHLQSVVKRCDITTVVEIIRK